MKKKAARYGYYSSYTSNPYVDVYRAGASWSTTGEITAVGAGTATITVTIYTGVTTATGAVQSRCFSGTPPAVMGGGIPYL